MRIIAVAALCLFALGAQARDVFKVIPPICKYQSCDVVILLHGGGGNGADFAKKAGMDKAALVDGKEFVLLAPTGSKRAGRGWCWASGNVCDDSTKDVEFLTELVQEARFDFNGRVIMAGFSSGGDMTYRILLERPGILDCFAISAGQVGVDTKVRYTRTVGLIKHSTNDTNVPYEGGVGSGASKTYRRSVDESIAALGFIGQVPRIEHIKSTDGHAWGRTFTQDVLNYCEVAK